MVETVLLIPLGRVCEVMTKRLMIKIAFYDGIEVFFSFFLNLLIGDKFFIEFKNAF